MKKIAIVSYTLILVLALSTVLMADGIEPSINGDGKYEISTLDHLLWISTNSGSWSSDFIQTADINASSTSNWNEGAGFSPIGNFDIKFTGTYDGNNHSIDNLYIYQPENSIIGLFGCLSGDVTTTGVYNLGVSNVNITGKNLVGGLIGNTRDYSTVNNCYSTGVVSGNMIVGGLIGFNYSNSTINNCYSTVNISASDTDAGGLVGQSLSSTINSSFSSGSVSGIINVGGLAGYINTNSTVSNCYSSCSVSIAGDNSDIVGGLVGQSANSTINNSYSTGSVSGVSNVGGLLGYKYYSTINNSFWNTETSGQLLSKAGTGKTTSEMKDVVSYTDINTTGLATAWDFVANPNDDINNNDYWAINASINDGYPYLTNTLPSEGATPITLTSFTAEAKQGNIELAWKTASETNNASFLVYRNDEVVAKIDGAGTTSETNNYVYVDASVIPGVSYTYILADVDYANKETCYSAKAVTVTLAKDIAEARFTIDAAYPNPFNPSTCINYTVAETQDIDLSIFNMKGEKVVTLFDGERTAGQYSQTWNASNVQSGVYLLRAKYANQVKTQKLLLIK